jgi:hypothetical protein
MHREVGPIRGLSQRPKDRGVEGEARQNALKNGNEASIRVPRSTCGARMSWLRGAQQIEPQCVRTGHPHKEVMEGIHQ